MALLAVVLATAAAVLAVLPGPLLYAAMAAGILAALCGRVALRARGTSPGRRVAGGAAAGLAALALVVCAARFGLTVLALGRLDALVS